MIRLLNVRTLELQKFGLDDAPSYAIASHTWVHGEEITYGEYKKSQGLEKLGHEKVTKFAHYVRECMHGVEWLWVDTCCINKEDDEEVQHSINSMFQWYHNAAICLAHLSDVEVGRSGTEIADKIRSERDVPQQEGQALGDFAESRWFKRGWTLQELLAPRVVVFLDLHWKVIGHKGDHVFTESVPSLDVGMPLNDIIAAITTIPEQFMIDCYQSRFFGLEERLAWMDGRETTRAEDLSYSLMGMFDVQMPLDYGEGKERARDRLLAQIKQNAIALCRLSAVPGAAYNSKENQTVLLCLPNTQTNLLQKINSWANSKDEERNILWLRSGAGTGKSSILKTVAHTFEQGHRLAASFCFSRGDRDQESASSLVTTVAAQLARNVPLVSAGIASALESESRPGRQSLKEQFRRLIFKPLSQLALSPLPQTTWLICIDALDECDNQSDIGTLLYWFARLAEIRKATFRVFVTSRHELPIRFGLDDKRERAWANVRHEYIYEDRIVQDVATYVKHELSRMRTEHQGFKSLNTLRDDWPGKDATQALMGIVQPLFSFAVTICRFLAEPEEDPQRMLDALLKARPDGSQLDKIYQPILERLVVDEVQSQPEQAANELHLIIGSIVTLAEPLTISAISALLEIPVVRVEARLERLHPVLDILTSDEGSRPVDFLHPSFRDYLTASENRDKTALWVNVESQHRDLAKRCLQLLSRNGVLHRDLCNIGEPGAKRHDIDKQVIRRSITGDVAYACRYWVYHLAAGKEQLHDGCEAHHFLKAHLLHWLEVLSWLGRVSDAVVCITDLQLLPQTTTGTMFKDFLEDARRFILRHRFAIDLAPLQTYASALIFSPTESIVKRQFWNAAPSWVLHHSGMDAEWGAEILRFHGLSSSIMPGSLIFAPDGRSIIASEMRATFSQWDVQTGAAMQDIEVPTRSGARAVAYSPNGDLLASGLSDGSIRLCTINQGQRGEITVLKGHREMAWCFAFSSNGYILASGSSDYTVRLWDLRKEQDKQICVLEGHKYAILALAFSPDGRMLASGSVDRTVRVWRLEASNGNSKAKEVAILEGHGGNVSAVAFSSDGQRVLSGSWDSTIRSWDIFTPEGNNKKVISLTREGDSISEMAFSSDGTLVASASRAGTMRIWDTRTGDVLCELDGDHLNINSLAISQDKRMLASAASHETQLRLWDIQKRTRPPIQEEERVNDAAPMIKSRINSPKWMYMTMPRPKVDMNDDDGDYIYRNTPMAFSPNEETMVSGSEDGNLWQWDVSAGNCLASFEPTAASAICMAAYSRDGQLIASGLEDGTVQLFDAHLLKLVATFTEHEETIMALAFSSDGQMMASGSADKTVRLWRVRSAGGNLTLVGHEKMVAAVAFSADDGASVVVSSAADATIRLWSTDRGELLHLFRDLPPWYEAIVYLPNHVDNHREQMTTSQGGRNTAVVMFSRLHEHIVATGSVDGSTHLANICRGADIDRFESCKCVEGLMSDVEDKPLQRNTVALRDCGSSTALSRREIPQPYGINTTSEWIRYEGKELLWLPIEYQIAHTAVRKNSLAICHRSNAMSFFVFDPDKLQPKTSQMPHRSKR